LSSVGFTSSLLSEIASASPTANQFVTDFNQLAQDLQSGNLSAAQQDYVTLSNDALDGTTSSTATSSASGITTSLLSDITGNSGSTTSFVDELNQLGTDLQNGDLTSAQGDMLSLDSTALNSAPASTASTGSTASSSSSTAAPANSAETAQLIHAVVEAMEAGNNSAISSALTELASVSSSSAGANILEQQSATYASGASSSPSSSSVSQLLQGLNGSSNSSSSVLSLLA
jgi:hypothetical protein